MSVNRSVRWAATAFIALLVAGACGSDDSEPTSSGSNSGATPLAGTPWLLGDSTSLGVSATGVAVTAEFGDGEMTGSSGCNSYRASVQIDGSSLTVGPVAGTRKACEPGPTAVETAYLARLPQVASYEITGTTLTLRSKRGTALLVYEASDDASEIVGAWMATSYYTGNAIESVAAGSTLTADFDADRISGNGGCNGFSGPYSVSGKTIEIGPLASTMMACTDQALNTQERHYLEALQLATSYRVTGTRLDLLRDGGTIAATFDATPAG
jgi:heat shock protein HslJ